MPGYIPRDEEKNKKSPDIATNAPMNRHATRTPRLCGIRVCTASAHPFRINKSAVLGAIGIRFVPKLVREEIRKIHPSSTRSPIAAEKNPAVIMKIFLARESLCSGFSCSRFFLISLSIIVVLLTHSRASHKTLF
jgi:hypothetical protein